MMAKGFGVKPDQQLGYVLELIPEAHAYAAKFSLDFKGEKGPFIGITNLLEDAQVWKSPKQAKEALETYYAEFVLEQLESGSEGRINLQRLIRSATGELKTEHGQTLFFRPNQLLE